MLLYSLSSCIIVAKMATYIEECQKHALLSGVYFGQRTLCLLCNHEPHVGKMLLRCVVGYDALLVGNLVGAVLNVEAGSSSEITVNNYQSTRRHPTQLVLTGTRTLGPLGAYQFLVYWVRCWCCYSILIHSPPAPVLLRPAHKSAPKSTWSHRSVACGLVRRSPFKFERKTFT